MTITILLNYTKSVKFVSTKHNFFISYEKLKLELFVQGVLASQ